MVRCKPLRKAHNTCKPNQKEDKRKLEPQVASTVARPWHGITERHSPISFTDMFEWAGVYSFIQ